MGLDRRRGSLSSRNCEWRLDGMVAGSVTAEMDRSGLNQIKVCLFTGSYTVHMEYVYNGVSKNKQNSQIKA